MTSSSGLEEIETHVWSQVRVFNREEHRSISREVVSNTFNALYLNLVFDMEQCRESVLARWDTRAEMAQKVWMVMATERIGQVQRYEVGLEYNCGECEEVHVMSFAKWQEQPPEVLEA